MDERSDWLRALRFQYLSGTPQALEAVADRLAPSVSGRRPDAEALALLAEVLCTQADTEPGETDRQRKLVAEARKLARAAIASDASSITSRRALGHTLIVDQRFDEAYTLLDQLARDAPQDAETQALLWRSHPDGRERCLPLVIQALSREPRLVRCFADACWLIAHAHQDPIGTGIKQAVPLAVHFIDRVGPAVVAQNPANIFVAFGMTVTAALLRNFGSAARWGRELHARSRHYGDMACGTAEELGGYFHSRGDKALAAELFRVCHEIDPDDAGNILNELWNIPVSARSRLLASRALSLSARAAGLQPQIEEAARLLRETEELATRGITLEYQRAFLSYPQSIVDDVYAVVDSIHRQGRPLRFFKDHASIVPGERWREALETAIRDECDAMVYFHARQAFESPYIRAEVAAAFAFLEPGRIIVVDTDGTYAARGGEHVEPLRSPDHAATALTDRLSVIERRPARLPRGTWRAKRSADIVATRSTSVQADSLAGTLESHGILALRRIVADESTVEPAVPAVPGAMTICLLTRDSLADERWRRLAEAAFARSLEWGDESFVPVLLDEARLPDRWGGVHALDVTRFQTAKAAMHVMAARLLGQDPADDKPETWQS